MRIRVRKRERAIKMQDICINVCNTEGRLVRWSLRRGQKR